MVSLSYTGRLVDPIFEGDLVIRSKNFNRSGKFVKNGHQNLVLLASLLKVFFIFILIFAYLIKSVILLLNYIYTSFLTISAIEFISFANNGYFLILAYIIFFAVFQNLIDAEYFVNVLV